MIFSDSSLGTNLLSTNGAKLSQYLSDKLSSYEMYTPLVRSLQGLWFQSYNLQYKEKLKGFVLSVLQWVVTE